MKVFLTGGSGFIGARVLQLLVAKGHAVSALARSEAGIQQIQAQGAKGISGELSSLDLIRTEAEHADAVLHLAYMHDFSARDKALDAELAVVQTINEALKGSNKPFIATSGVGVLGQTDGPADEAHPLPSNNMLGSRLKAEKLMKEGAQQGVRTCVLRLPLYVYDENSAAFARFKESKDVEEKVASYIGTGQNMQSCVHVDDVAQLYLLALQHAKAGTVYHGTNGAVTVHQMAEATASKYGFATRSITQEQAQQLYGPFFSYVYGLNNVGANARAMSELSWRPKHGSEDFLIAIAGKAA